MNKFSKERHLGVGPSQPETAKLIDISGNKMTMLYEAYTTSRNRTSPNPQGRRPISPIEVYPKAENTNPNAVWEATQAGVTRSGNKVGVKMVAIRSRFVPDKIEVRLVTRSPST